MIPIYIIVIGILDILSPIMIGITEYSKNSPTIDFPCGFFGPFINQMSVGHFIILSLALIIIGILQILSSYGSRLKIKITSVVINTVFLVITTTWLISLWNAIGVKNLPSGMRCNDFASNFAINSTLLFSLSLVPLLITIGIVSIIVIKSKADNKLDNSDKLS